MAIKNLEENLTQIETELCNHKEKEIEYKREIFHLEADILKLKQHNEHFSKSFIRKPNQKTNTSTEILKEFEDNTSSLLLEKDKQIFSLKEKLNEIEIYYQTQLNSCIEQLNQKLHNNPKQCFLGSEVNNFN